MFLFPHCGGPNVAPSFNVGATPLRRWCRILDLQLVFVFSLWWPNVAPSFNGATPLRRWCRILDLQLVFVFSLWRDPSEEVVQDFGPSTCFCFLTVVAPMLTRENEGSKKSVRKVVQDFVHQQYGVSTTLQGCKT